MNKKFLFSLVTIPLIITACGGNGETSDPTSAGQSSIDVHSSENPDSGLPSITSVSFSSEEKSSKAGPSQEGHDQDDITRYMNNLKKTSEANHFYYHYYRFPKENKTFADDYNDWDVWCWPYLPKPRQGYRFDWQGRVSAADRMSATGNATIDEFGYVCADIDLTQEYNGGWNNTKKTIGGKTTHFYVDDEKTTFVDQIGLQIVLSDTRTTSEGFWTNDGSNLYVTLEDYALENEDGSTSYHCFVTQDNVQDPSGTPPLDNTDPFIGDDGSNYTYGKAAYSNVNFSQTPERKATSPLFLNGDNNKSYLKKGAGVGYQIMVSSFADSDGDGFGDIYGIYQKLDYLKDLGVNVLWLTPIQVSDSYHGYDIADYTQVDVRYGSKASPNTKNDTITNESAMEDYMDLIEAAHSKGMAVIMDLVLNHTSTTNKWFIKSAQLDTEKRGYYQWGNHTKKDADHPYGQSDKINQEKFWYPYGSHDYSYYAKFGSSMPELNYAYVDTRTAVATMAKQWCEAGVDGFRMDAVKHIFLEEEVTTSAGDKIVKDISTDKLGFYKDYSSNLTKNLHFWRQLAYDVKSVYPNCFFVGENFDGHAYQVAPYYEGFDSLFDFYSYFNLTTLAAKSYGAKANTINGGPTSAHNWVANGGSDSSGNKWDLLSVLGKNNSYRGGSASVNSTTGYTAIDGMFTSNHDIARTINRIAGEGDLLDSTVTQKGDGLVKQGNVTTSNFATLDKLATLVQITELMMPGCTWIYYGDEIGMTGNFPNTTYSALDVDGKERTFQYDKDAPYADLWYRQPMKWTANGKVGDGSMTTGFEITGSTMSVEWDSLNKTSTMKSVAEQMSATSSHYKAIKAFATAKSQSPALIKGNITEHGWDGNGSAYIFNFDRKLGNEEYRIMINMSSSNYPSLGTTFNSYTQVASFNGASKTALPAYSAVLLKK